MPELEPFLRAAKAQGASDEFLVALLTDQGWPPAEVYRALGRFYAESTGLPIPTPPSRMESAREAFFHLLAFSTLASWIIATGSLWFILIDAWFPDATRSYYMPWSWHRVSWQMASIIVAFPAFVFATNVVLSDMEANPDKAASPIRRWLTNIALLVAALVSIGDLMAFVATFLQGELTVRFVCQCLTVFALAGAVFLYYNRGTAKASAAPRNWNRGFALGAAAAILLSLGLGFLKTGSPAEQRLRAEDHRRVEDLYQIANRIHDHWQQARDLKTTPTLPPSLDTLTTGANTGLVTSDPFTHQPYEFKPGTGAAYQLCAIFSTATPDIPNRARPAWAHPQGAVCIDLDASRRPEYPGGY